MAAGRVSEPAVEAGGRRRRRRRVRLESGHGVVLFAAATPSAAKLMSSPYDALPAKTNRDGATATGRFQLACPPPIRRKRRGDFPTVRWSSHHSDGDPALAAICTSMSRSCGSKRVAAGRQGTSFSMYGWGMLEGGVARLSCVCRSKEIICWALSAHEAPKSTWNRLPASLSCAS